MAALWEISDVARGRARSALTIGMQVQACSLARDSDPDENPMLTSDVQLHCELVQHHLQTLPSTTQSYGTKSGGATYISWEFS
jgi:hypothetical protein